jgi:hypothetical protein
LLSTSTFARTASEYFSVLPTNVHISS